MWQPLMRTGALGASDVQPVVIAGAQAVVWRAGSGAPCAVARHCPHLDWDLADGAVHGAELVCLGHGWSITGDGRAFKRNERGREDAKGRTRAWVLRERDGWIDVQLA